MRQRCRDAGAWVCKLLPPGSCFGKETNRGDAVQFLILYLNGELLPVARGRLANQQHMDRNKMISLGRDTVTVWLTLVCKHSLISMWKMAYIYEDQVFLLAVEGRTVKIHDYLRPSPSESRRTGVLGDRSFPLLVSEGRRMGVQGDRNHLFLTRECRRDHLPCLTEEGKRAGVQRGKTRLLFRECAKRAQEDRNNEGLDVCRPVLCVDACIF